MAKRDQHRPVILLADDPQVGPVMRGLFAKAGLANLLIVYQDVVTLLDKLAQIADDSSGAQVPCLLLVDLKTTELSSADVIEWTRQHPALSSMKIVALATSNAVKDRERALAAGADSYLVKYPTPAELSTLVRDCS